MVAKGDVVGGMTVGSAGALASAWNYLTGGGLSKASPRASDSPVWDKEGDVRVKTPFPPAPKVEIPAAIPAGPAGPQAPEGAAVAPATEAPKADPAAVPTTEAPATAPSAPAVTPAPAAEPSATPK